MKSKQPDRAEIDHIIIPLESNNNNNNNNNNNKKKKKKALLTNS